MISGRRPRSLGAHEWSWDRLPCSAQFSKTNVALGWVRLRDFERIHLFDLARRGAATAPPAERNEPSTVRSSLRRLVESRSSGGTGACWTALMTVALSTTSLDTLVLVLSGCSVSI